MDRLPLTLHDSPSLLRQSPPKDQLYYPNTSLQSVPSSWPPTTYSMDLGDARSDPTTPDGQDGSFYSEPGTLNGASGSMGYFHSKTLSNGSSMEGASRTSFSDDAASFASLDAAAQPHQNQNYQQQTQTLRLANQHQRHHHPSSSYAAAHTQMQMNTHHGPPLAYNPYGEHSLVQQAPSSNFMRLPGISSANGSNNDGNGNGNQNQNQMHHGSHPGNPPQYHLAFNGLEISPPPPPPSPSPSPSTPAGGNWNLNLMHNNNNNNHVYSHVQGGGGVPVLPPSAYGGAMGILPSNHNLNFAALGQGPNLFTNFHIAQIQQYLGLRNAYGGMNVSGGLNTNMPPHNLEASQLGLSMSGGGGAPVNTSAGTRPQSQSTMSTPSLAGNSPTLPWSPLFDSASASQGSGGGSTVGSISYSAPVVVRGPPTPPQLVNDVMPPKPVLFDRGDGAMPPPITFHAKPPPITLTAKPRPRHRSSEANTSISSVRSPGQSQPVSPEAMPMSPGPSAIPLRVRVNALPKDKRTLFERAAGELWNPREDRDHEDGGVTLTHSQVMGLEDLYALVGSDQLRDQVEIPDDLVEPILRTILLPRADAQRGSRGGAAGHLCLWAGCGKTIKRLDHSRNHIREHCKSKPHSCGGQGSKGCGQTFLRMDDLKRHQKSHCSVLRSGPGRRPRSIRGTRRRETDDEEEERDSEDSTSLNGGDDEDYRPIHTRAHQTSAVASSSSASTSATTTRELASRLRSQRQRAARYVCDESTEESDSGNHHDHVAVIGRLQTSNVRRAVESPVEHPNPNLNPGAGEDADVDMESQKNSDSSLFLN